MIRVETTTYIRGHWQGEILNEINWFFAPLSDHLIKKLVNRLLNVRFHRLNMVCDEERLDHGPLMRVSRGVHVDEGGLVLGGGLAAGTEFREARSRAFLCCTVLVTLDPQEFRKIHLRQAGVCSHGADVFVFCHEPCHRAVEKLDARDRLCGAQASIFGWRLEA